VVCRKLLHYFQSQRTEPSVQSAAAVDGPSEVHAAKFDVAAQQQD
jgi:hypothetical protein